MFLFDYYTKSILQYDFLRLTLSSILAALIYLYLSYSFKLNSLTEIINIIKKIETRTNN